MSIGAKLSGSARMTIVRGLPPNGGGAETPGSVANIGPHLEQRRVLQILELHVRVVAGEDEIADGHAAGVEAHDERRDGAGGMNARARFTYATVSAIARGHVGAGVELQLDQRDALDVLALDVLDAVDVEEVVLVVVGDEPFHLGGVHAAVRLGDVERRDAEVGEDIARHPLHREQTGQQRGNRPARPR